MKSLLYLYLLLCIIFINLTAVFAKDVATPPHPVSINSTERVPPTQVKTQLNLASIELLIEQEVGRIVLPQFYQNIGITVEVTPLPGKRAQYAANSGAQDGEIMRIWSYGDEALNMVRVPTPYYYLETMPFVLKSSGIVIESRQDLAKYRLARIRGVKHTNNITKGLSKVYDMNSTEKMFKLLLNHKVDVVLTNTIDGNLAIERHGLNKVIAMEKPLAELSLYHYLHKKHQYLVPIIDKEIKRLKGTGELKRIILNAEQRVIELNNK